MAKHIIIQGLFFLTFLTGFFAPLVVHSQSSPYRNYSVKDGLVSSEVYYVMQDSKGYMWFCTNLGVCKYDGYEFKTYNSSNGLPGSTFFECKEDYKGRIWFTSLSGKIGYYYHDSVFSLAVNDTIPTILKTSFITGLSVDTNENLYLSASGDDGIIYIDLKKKHSISVLKMPANTYYMARPSSGAPLFGNTVPGTGVLRGNSKWRPPADTVQLSLFSLHGNRFIPINSLPWKRHAIYIVDKNDMAVPLDKDRTAISLYSAFIICDNNKIVFSHIFSDIILKLCKAKNGDIWIIVKDQAPYIYRNGEIIQNANLNFLKNKQITSAYVDAEGGLWFTSLQFGVFYIAFPDMENWTTENGLPNNKVTGIYNSPDGSLWTVEESSKIISIIKHDSVSQLLVPQSWLGSAISSILFRENGIKWISTTEGIYILNDKNSVIARPERITLGMNTMLPLDVNSVFANSYSGLFKMEKQGDSVTHKESIQLKAKVFALSRDTENNIWLGTRNGLYEYTHDTLIFSCNKYPLLSNVITDIKCYKGQLWMATGDNGVIAKIGDSVLHFTTKNGLAADFCSCIFIDNEGVIWVGTNKGLSQITVQNIGQPAGHINIKNIISFNLIEVHYITGEGNMLYVGTNNGVIAFDSRQEITYSLSSPIYITEVKVNDKTLVQTADKTQLPYDENYIIINYRCLTYRDAGNTFYRYKMIGIDTGWHYTKNTNVQYPRLEPGKYTFLVSAMNNDGVWNESHATFSFLITPPFWSTWWARALAILIVVFFIYWRIKLIENREKKKTETNRQIATMELRELEKQMDPHFLFNNLGALKYLIDTNTNEAQLFVDELSQFYRYNLLHRKKGFTELQSEIEQAKRYLGLLKIRFGEQFFVEWNIDHNLLEFYLPTLSLQLLLENITKHNIVSSDAPLKVEILSTDTSSLIVRNHLKRKKTNIASTGHGLKNIREHYNIETGKEVIIHETSEYFSVELPLIPPDTYESINN